MIATNAHFFKQRKAAEDAAWWLDQSLHCYILKRVKKKLLNYNNLAELVATSKILFVQT